MSTRLSLGPVPTSRSEGIRAGLHWPHRSEESRLSRRIKPAPVVAATNATVTVIIPSFNLGRYLPDAVNSALTQTGVELDVVIVDDCSTDDSKAVAHALAARDPRVLVMENERNLGPVATFNAGLAHAGGTYLVRLDADDVLTPGSLARSIGLMILHPNVGMVYGRPVHFVGEVPTAFRSTTTSWTIWPGEAWLAARCASGLNVITSPEVVMRGSVVSSVGGQKPLAHTHDMEMWLRLASVADVGHVDGPDQAWHREHAGSLSSQVDDPVGLYMLEERRRAFDYLFAGRAGELANAELLRTAARDALAREAIARATHLLDRGRGDTHLGELQRFAVESSPDVRSSREWRAMQRRLRFGHRFAPWLPWHAAAALRRRVLSELRHRHWLRWGVYKA